MRMSLCDVRKSEAKKRKEGKFAAVAVNNRTQSKLRKHFIMKRRREGGEATEQVEEEGVKRRLSSAWREGKLDELRKEELSSMLEERGVSGAGGKASLIKRAEKFAPTLFHSTDIKLGDVKVQTSAGPQVVPERPPAPPRPAAPAAPSRSRAARARHPAPPPQAKSTRLCEHGALKEFCGTCVTHKDK